MWSDVRWSDLIYSDEMWCGLMWCDVISCDAMPCAVIDIMTHDMLYLTWCDVIWSKKSSDVMTAHSGHLGCCLTKQDNDVWCSMIWEDIHMWSDADMIWCDLTWLELFSQHFASCVFGFADSRRSPSSSFAGPPSSKSAKVIYLPWV